MCVSGSKITSQFQRESKRLRMHTSKNYYMFIVILT